LTLSGNRSVAVGLFWLGHFSPEFEFAMGWLRAVDHGGAGIDRLALGTRGGHSGSDVIPKLADQYAYQTVNDLLDAYTHAMSLDLTHAVVSFGNGIPTSLAKLAALVDAMGDRIWGFRICRIAGASFRASACHFSDFGGRRAHLLSMIEHSVDSNELYNFHSPQDSKDRWGNTIEYDPLPFHLCERTGFLTCYPGLIPHAELLVKRNLGICARTGYERILDQLRLRRKRGNWYLNDWLAPSRPIVRSVKALLRTDHLDFQKRYDNR
jgi:hypothetical protein